jgi:hypothetical protein
LPEETGLTLLEQDVESALAAIPSGYGECVYEGLRYGATVRKPRDGKRTSLFARALAGGDVVSFNLYRLRSGEDSLPPCEMPAEKVVAFVLGYIQVQAHAPLKLPREVPRLGCHDCEGRADALELILRGLGGAQLSGAERTPVASEETQDECPLRRSCSEEWR